MIAKYSTHTQWIVALVIVLFLTSCLMDKRPVFIHSNVKVDSRGLLLFTDLHNIKKNKYFEGYSDDIISIVVFEYSKTAPSMRRQDAVKIYWEAKTQDLTSLPSLPKNLQYGVPIEGMVTVAGPIELIGNKTYKMELHVANNSLLGIWSFFTVMTDADGKITAVKQL